MDNGDFIMFSKESQELDTELDKIIKEAEYER